MFQLAQLPRTIDAALRDSEAVRVDVRKSALADLVFYADGTARSLVAGALRRLLRNDLNGEVRSLAAIACADAGLSELLPDLLEALDDENPRVTQMVLLALGELPLNVADVDVLRVMAFLDSELPALRYQAISTLYRLREADTAPRLWLAIRDPDTEIQWLGWRLLDVWQAKVDGQTVHETILDLRKLEHRKMLFALAEKAPPKVKAEAGLLLLRLNEPNVLGLLLPLLERPRGLESGQSVRLIMRMGEVNCRSSIPWLSLRARVGWFEGRYGWVSLCALARMGERSARKTIVAELNSSSARRRCRALDAVRALHLAEALPAVTALAKTGAAGMTAAEAQAVLADLRQHDHRG